MYIKVEPKDWNMFSVFLIFDRQAPHAEDEAVRSYIKEHGLVAKRRSTTTVEERECEVLYFGGCYLRNHLGAISQIQAKVLGRQMLAAAVPSLLQGGPNLEAQRHFASMGDAQRQAALDVLLDELNQESSFAKDAEGREHVTLDATSVQNTFLAQAAAGVNKS